MILGIIQIIYLLPIVPSSILRTWLLGNWETNKQKLEFMWKGTKLAIDNAIKGDNTCVYDYSYFMSVRTEEKIEYIRKVIL